MTTSPSNPRGPRVGDRELVEAAVQQLLLAAPPGWQHLHAEFEPARQLAQVQVNTADGQQHSVTPDQQVLAAIVEHQRRAERPWRRLVLDCHADGRLSARTDPAPPRPRRWPTQVLAGITAACSIAAVTVFAVGWRIGPPPRADMIAVPAQTVLQGEAMSVVEAWFSAENRADVATMRALACRQPSQVVLDEIESASDPKNLLGVTYPDAIVEFRDNGTQVWAKIAVRVHPLTEVMRRDVQDAQDKGGFLTDQYTFVEEGGQLKICDSDLEAP